MSFVNPASSSSGPVTVSGGTIDRVTIDVPYLTRNAFYWPSVSGEQLPPTLSSMVYGKLYGMPAYVPNSTAATITFPNVPRIGASATSNAVFTSPARYRDFLSARPNLAGLWLFTEDAQKNATASWADSSTNNHPLVVGNPAAATPLQASAHSETTSNDSDGVRFYYQNASTAWVGTDNSGTTAPGSATTPAEYQLNSGTITFAADISNGGGLNSLVGIGNRLQLRYTGTATNAFQFVWNGTAVGASFGYLFDNAPHHWVITWNLSGSSLTCILYVDGTVLFSRTATVSAPTNTGGFFIGTPSGASLIYDISHLALYSAVWDQATVTNAYNAWNASGSETYTQSGATTLILDCYMAAPSGAKYQNQGFAQYLYYGAGPQDDNSSNNNKPGVGFSAGIWAIGNTGTGNYSVGTYFLFVSDGVNYKKVLTTIPASPATGRLVRMTITCSATNTTLAIDGTVIAAISSVLFPVSLTAAQGINPAFQIFPTANAGAGLSTLSVTWS